MNLLSVVEDIAHRIEAEERADLFVEAHEFRVAEESSLTLADRVRAARGTFTTLSSRGVTYSGNLRASGQDWLLVEAGIGQRVVPFAGLDTIELARGARFESRRLPQTLHSLLRGLLDEPLIIDGAAESHRGVLGAVGRDYLQLDSVPLERWDRSMSMHDSPDMTSLVIPMQRVVGIGYSEPMT